MRGPQRTRKPVWQQEDGVAAVEFAIIMTLLFIIVFGIVEFGIAFSKLNVYTGAAREGARFASVRCQPTVPPPGGCTNALIQDKVKEAGAGYLDGMAAGTVSADRVCSNTTIGQYVKVSWSQAITINIPFIPGLNPATYTRTVEGVFRCE